jgi:hypothetical protein
MAYCRMISSQLAPDGGTALCFANIDPNLLAQDVQMFFTQMGYKYEGGTQWRSMWGKGDDTMRVFFGAFVERYQFAIAIDMQPGTPYVWLKVSKGISGAAGGIIGYTQMDSELSRIVGMMQRFFSM